GDLAAVAVLREAAEANAHRAPRSAARWFGIALGLLPDSAPYAERVELLMALAQAQAATGRFEDSRAALIESIALTPGDDEPLRGSYPIRRSPPPAPRCWPSLLRSWAPFLTRSPAAPRRQRW